MQKMTESPSTKINGIAMLGEKELVAMMASLMALNALALDMMLPAFPEMSRSFGLVDPNAIQYVVSAYLIGMGAGSIVYGPLSDRYGRKTIILPTVVAYAMFSLACRYAPNYEAFLALRLCQGLCGAATSVLITAIIRDCFEGDAMAKRLSLIFMTFMIVPIIAPAIGAVILTFAPWQMMFDIFALLAAALAIWIWLRLPETLAEENVIPIRAANIIATWKNVVSNRLALGYVLGAGLSFGSLYAYLAVSEPLFTETFDAQEFFPIGFGIIALGIGFANFFNSRIVERFGARRVSQGAAIVFILLGVVQLFGGLLFPGSLFVFMVLITINMAMVGFMGSNFSSIAMQPFGAMAGAASSFQNFVRTLLGALIGVGIGQQFDGTVTPIALGFVICGIAGLTLVFWAESYKLFTRPNSAPKSPM